VEEYEAVRMDWQVRMDRKRERQEITGGKIWMLSHSGKRDNLGGMSKVQTGGQSPISEVQSVRARDFWLANTATSALLVIFLFWASSTAAQNNSCARICDGLPQVGRGLRHFEELVVAVQL
jgi:hypothetical protein